MKLTARALSLASIVVPILLVVGLSSASAAGVGGGNVALPWETALDNLQSALTGKTAQVICVIAIFIAGIALIFGEDLGHFAKRLLMIVIAAAFIVGATGFVNNFVTPSGGSLI